MIHVYIFFFRNSVDAFTDPKLLVSEPQDLELSGPSNDIFYTPTSEICTNPITPPNINHDLPLPSPLKLEENEHRTLSSPIENENDREKSNEISERSRDEQID